MKKERMCFTPAELTDISMALGFIADATIAECWDEQTIEWVENLAELERRIDRFIFELSE